MYSFKKNRQGEYIEGYLGEQENFNGIIFLLREPNDDDPKIFWFKNALYKKKIYNDDDSKKDITKSKRAATKYKNEFVKMLKSVGYEEKDLFNAIYCNVHPDFGCTQLSNKGKEEVNPDKLKKMIDFFCTLKSDITVFTCKTDIYKILSKMYNISPNQEKEGLCYKNRLLKYFECKINNTNFKIYEIYHPSSRYSIENQMANSNF